jgi:TetR/AcrR family transcriptional repressor of nem operon
MARPREFDEGQALDRAMEVFWRRGYQGTSTDDLMRAMGIGRGSFYNTFGSKKAVYLRTLDRYLEIMADGGPYTVLAEAKPGVDAIEAQLDAYLASLVGDAGPHGCYFVHVAKEHRGADPDVQSAVVEGIERMKGLLGRSIRAAQDQGALPPELDPDHAAVLLMSVAWGLHVLLEAGVPRAEVMGSARQLFDLARTTPPASPA